MNIKTINCQTLKNWLENDQAILVDVREIEENMASHIKDSILIPLGFISLNKIPDLSGKKLVMQCRSGKRSASACEKLLTENPNLDIYNLEGGILAWASCNYPIETNK